MRDSPLGVKSAVRLADEWGMTRKILILAVWCFLAMM
jgi:hypothetical protein